MSPHEQLIDLEQKQFALLRKIIKSYISNKTVWAYGSRVSWKADERSDLDLALFDCSPMEISELKEALEESDLLISVDVMDWENIPAKFQENIKKKYVVLQEKTELKTWREVKLGDICTDISYGYTASAANEQLGPKLLRITDIVPDQINWELVPYCKIDINNKEKYLLSKGDIVIARTGATTGYNKIIKDNIEAVFASYLIRYRVDRKTVYAPYVGHILQSQDWNSFVESIKGGSAQPGANAKQLGSFEFLLPLLPEQKAIAEALTSLDDKIDLLHRQNKTLEDMAQALFRKWFIEDADEGWEEKPLDEVADYLNGLACQKYPPKNELNKLPVLKIKELNSGITDNSDWAASEIDEKYIVELGDVIFSWSGSLVLKIWDGEKCILNQHLFKITSEKYPKWFFYFWTKYHLEKFIAIANAKATTMGHIKRGDLSNSRVLVPSESEIEKMSKAMQPNFDKTISNQKQIRTLEKLRDMLLPKLMSGEVRVGLSKRGNV